MKSVKKSFRRMMAFLLAMVMCLGMTVTAFATEGTGTAINQIVNEGGKVYYLANGETASEENYDVWTSKTIAETGTENEFEVTLQVGSTMQAFSRDVAVVLVVDTSGSMMSDEDGKLWYEGTTLLDRPENKKLRIEYAREAMLDFAENYVKGSGDAKRMLSIVEFGNNAYTALAWTDANNDGTLNKNVETVIESVDVNFKYDNRSFWNPEAAVKYFGSTECPDDVSCENLDPNHIHACVYGEGSTKPFYDVYTGENNYRCLNADPNHTHDVYDGDRYYVMDDRELQKYKSVATNMEGGLLLARNLLTTGLEAGGAIEGIDDTYVILLSDGVPTFHVIESSTTEVKFVLGEKGGGSYAWQEDWEDIVSNGTVGDVALAEDIKDIAELYAILYGSGLAQRLGYNLKGQTFSGSHHELKEVTGEDWITLKNEEGRVNYVGADSVFKSVNSSDLSSVFENIGQRIELLSKVWTVTDALSDEVAFDSFTLNGEYASYDKNDHAITWRVGDMEPENENAAGTVADPYVYTLKYKVKLNPDAEGVYEASADNTGVNTNKGATLYYIQTDNDTDLNKLPYEELKAKAKEAAFEHPSVKAFYTEYEFTKKSAKDESVLANVGFTLYKDGAVWSDEVFSDAEGKVKFDRISAGEYKMRETTVLDGMQYMAPFEFVVSYGKITTKSGAEMPDVIYNDTNERVLEFIKNTEIGGVQHPLKGIEFEIYYVGTVEDYNTFIDTVLGTYSGSAEDFAAAVQEKFTVSKADEIRVKGTEPVATVKTDEAGHAVYNLTENQQPDGIYMIVEKSHNAIAKTLAPFVVAVPSTNEDGNPVYHLDLNLKNEIFRPEVDKDVTEIGQKEDSQNVGENVTWIVRGDIPKDIKDALLYKLTDVVDYRLTYAGNLIVKVELIEDEANNSPTVGTLLIDGTDYTLNATPGSVDVNPDENVTQMEDITTIVVELTQAGREKIATMVGDAYDTYELRVYFDTYIDEDAQLGIEIPNTVTLEYTNSANFEWKVVPEENPDVYTCGINIHKYDAKDKKTPLAGAKFMLARAATDADRAADGVVIEKLVVEKGVMKDVVFVKFYDNAAMTGIKVDNVTTTETGDAIIYGLEAGDYYLVETKAPAGYNLLSYPLKVTLGKTSHAAANTVGVANSNTFELPSTGGIGTTIFTLVGAALTLGSGAVLAGKKRKEETEE